MSYELGSYPDSPLPVPRSREAGSLACLRFWRFVAASLIADSSSVRRPGVPEVEGALLSRRVPPFPVSRDRHDLVDLEGHRMPGRQRVVDGLAAQGARRAYRLPSLTDCAASCAVRIARVALAFRHGSTSPPTGASRPLRRAEPERNRGNRWKEKSAACLQSK